MKHQSIMPVARTLFLLLKLLWMPLVFAWLWRMRVFSSLAQTRCCSESFIALMQSVFKTPLIPEEFFPQYPCTGLLVNLTREKSLHTRSSCESICEFLLRDVKRQKSFSFFFFFNHVVFVLASEKNLRLLDSPCISFLWIYNLWHLACVHIKKILGWVLCIPGKTTAGFKYKQKCQFKCIHGLVYFFIFSLAHALVRYKPRAPRVRPGSLWPTDLSCAAHKDRLQD